MDVDDKLVTAQDGQGDFRLLGVTAVIPVYNGETFLEETVRSAAAQTYPYLKIIAIDDGSTDRSADILEDLERSIPNLTVRRVKNGGVARARNLGTELSDTPYVAYLDHDDLWHPTKIEKQMTALLKHADDPSWAGCYTANRVIDENSQLRRAGIAFPTRGFFFGSHIVLNHVGNGSNFLVRRSAALEVGGFDTSYQERGTGGLEDWDFQLQILQHFKAEYVPECLVGYRMFGGTMSSNYETLAHAAIAVAEKFTRDARVPAALRRVAFSAAYRYAAPRFFHAGKYGLAIRYFLVQLWLDPLFGPPIIIRKTWYRCQDWLRYKRFGYSDQKGEALSALSFFSLEPTEQMTRMDARRPRSLEKWLAKMDRRIEAATRSKVRNAAPGTPTDSKKGVDTGSGQDRNTRSAVL